MAWTIQNVRRGGRLLSGVETFNLDQFAMTDKIINLKFYRRDGTTFSLRSDYEVAWNSDGTVPYFIPIKIKPCITVEYKQVAQGTSVQVFIKITNFSILTEKSGESILNNTDSRDSDGTVIRANPIVKIDVVMGYRRQFPDWTQPPLNYDTPESTNPISAENRLSLFYNMTDITITNAREAQDTALKIAVPILATYAENLPPDRVTVFQGVIGNMDYGRPFTSTVSLRRLLTESARWPREGTFFREVGQNFTVIEQAFFILITQRFFRPDIVREIYDSRYDQNIPDAAEREMWVKVLDYNPATQQMVPDTPERNRRPMSERWVQLDMPGGALTVEDAVALGVRVVCSDRVRRMSRNNLLAVSAVGLDAEFDELSELSDEDLLGGQRVPDIAIASYLGAQMTAIRDVFPSIRWLTMMNGDYFVYHADELTPELEIGMTAERARRQMRPVLLPAVYDISIGALRKIRCPFIGFLSPGQVVGFSSRYSLGSFIGFYVPSPKDRWFMIIIADVKFSTVEEANMMELLCVDTGAPSELVTLGNEDAQMQQAEEGASAAQATLSLRFARMTIGTWQTQRAFRITTWGDLAETLLNNAYVQRLPETPKWSDVDPSIVDGREARWVVKAEMINWFLAQGDGSVTNAELTAEYRVDGQGAYRLEDLSGDIYVYTGNRVAISTTLQGLFPDDEYFWPVATVEVG